MKKKTVGNIVFYLAEVVAFFLWYRVVHPALMNTETDVGLIVAIGVSFIGIPAIVIVQVVDLVKKYRKKEEIF